MHTCELELELEAGISHVFTEGESESDVSSLLVYYMYRAAL